MSKRLVFLVFAATLAAGLVSPAHAAGSKTPWIHIQVHEQGKDGAKVNLNLPLSAAELALDLTENEIVAKGRIKIDRHDVSVSDLRRIWQEVRAAGDADLATIENKEDTVRISQKDGRVLIEVHERGGGKEKVRIDVPASAIDALFAGEEENLDLRGALAQISSDPGEFIAVDDGKKRVRVWVD